MAFHRAILLSACRFLPRAGIRLSLLAMAAFLAAPHVAAAQSVESFYKGRTVTLIIPTSPGGINNLSARLVSRHLGRFIPGNPTITVKNVPEGGGLGTANAFATTTPRDGSVIAVIQRAVPQLAIQGDPKAHFDPLKFTWLGSLSSFADDAYMIVVNASYPAKTAADLKKPGPPAKFGADGIGSTNYTIGVVAKETLGYNLTVSPDYSGAANIFKAMQSGELDGQIIGLNSIRANQRAVWEGKTVRPLVQFGRTTRHPDLPDVPTARELTTDPTALAIIAFTELPFEMALPFMAPPDVPADRAAALQSGFARMMTDADFLADAKRSKLDISPVSGDAVKALLVKAVATPKDIIARYNAMTTKK
jgi:tripartite-type tricarboxylate transporter receptor subunit TctC